MFLLKRQVNIHEIVIIFFILGGKRIHGPVGCGERVHERGQTPLDHGKKRIPDIEMVGSAQNGVFQYVGNPG
jgi:hypothetical protein